MQAVAEKDERLAANLRTIAIWHFEHAARKLRCSADKLAEAGAIQTKKSGEFLNALRQLNERAEKADEILHSLRSDEQSTRI